MFNANSHKIRKVRTNIYVGQTTKKKAQEVLNQYGLSLSEAINLFLGGGEK